MKNKKGFTLIELLAVIVVLAIVMVLAATTVLPYMSTARKDSFLIEASDVINGAESAKDLYALGKVTVANDSTSCVKDTTLCFTVDYLISLGIYEADATTFEGKVTITNYNTSNPSYELYFQKGSEFVINGGTQKDYTKYTGGVTGTLATNGATCNCG